MLHLTLLKSNAAYMISTDNIIYVSFSTTRHEVCIRLLKANVDDSPFLALKAIQ